MVDVDVFLKCVLAGIGTGIIVAILGNMFFYFEIPQKIRYFFIYHIYAGFFPDKFEKTVFYTDGSWHTRTPDEYMYLCHIKRFMESEHTRAGMVQRFVQQNEGAGDPNASTGGGFLIIKPRQGEGGVKMLERRVTRSGVVVRGTAYWHPKLLPYCGTNVLVKLKKSGLKVYGRRGVPICTAEKSIF